MTELSKPPFRWIDVSKVPEVPETNLEELFGVEVVERRDDYVLARVTLTQPALDYLYCFSSDRNAKFHSEKELVQGSLWMWLLQLVVSEWIPLKGPLEFSGRFPEPTFSSATEQFGYELEVTKVKRDITCVARGPFGGEQVPEVFQFRCQLFPMPAALRLRRK